MSGRSIYDWTKHQPNVQERCKEISEKVGDCQTLEQEACFSESPSKVPEQEGVQERGADPRENEECSQNVVNCLISCGRGVGCNI